MDQIAHEAKILTWKYYNVSEIDDILECKSIDTLCKFESFFCFFIKKQKVYLNFIIDFLKII
jgi:hypothetical protein